jgi:ArsR family transcriptional regulator
MSDAGFVTSRRENKFVYYQIVAGVLTEHPFVVAIFEQELKRDAFFGDELKKLAEYHQSELSCHQVSAMIMDARQSSFPDENRTN